MAASGSRTTDAMQRNKAKEDEVRRLEGGMRSVQVHGTRGSAFRLLDVRLELACA